MNTPLVSGKYYLIEQDPRLNLSITGQWQPLDDPNLKVTSEPNIYVLSGHGSLYVGSTANVTMRRPKDHLYLFEKGKHRNPHMQAVWDKHGVFSYQVVTIIPADLLEYRNQIENAYIRLFDTYDNGYNMTQFADVPGSRKNRRHKSYRFLDPEGNVIETSDLTEWCRVRGIDSTVMYAVVRGSRTSHGYRPYDPSQVGKAYQYVRPCSRTYVIIDPDGNTLHVDDLKGFCRERRLVYPAFWYMASGKTRSSQGYTRP